MNAGKSLVISLVAAVLAACTVFPQARDVIVSGVVRSQDGHPLNGVSIYYATLKFRPGMPGVGEHGYVNTDSDGRYVIRIEAVYDVLSLSEIGSEFGCGTLADISGSEFVRSRALARNFVCPQVADMATRPVSPEGSE